MPRFPKSWVCAALLLSIAAGWACAGPDRDLPHVVVIVLDTARADYFSAYGYPRQTSPTFDRLAAESTLFQRAFSTDFWTLPSHASLFTGRYPSEVGATSETLHLPEDALTLGERLEDLDYRTVAASSNPWISNDRGFGQGFEELAETWRPDPERASDDPDDRTVEQAVRWIGETADDGRPLFLFVNLNRAHMPYNPGPGWTAQFVGTQTPPRRRQQLRELTGPWSHLAGFLELDEADLATLRDLYAAEIRHLDGSLGRILDALNAAGILDDSILIITADHGENLGEHDMLGHTLSMYDTTLRVPLLVRYPGVCAPGATDDLVSLIDVAPTVLAAAGVEGTGPDLCAPVGRGRERVFAENERPVKSIELLTRRYPRFDATRIDHRMRMVRSPGDKLIWRVEAGTELYDLEADPEELEDQSHASPELRARRLDEILVWEEQTRRPDSPAPRDLADRETVERLRALGYLGSDEESD